ncbi:MAG: DNA primase [Candidatus Pacebacteria bacterium]|jgi:DNA primase|nr:DNA primase [Candidatus Paceibacterota bacterium]
MNSSPVEEIKNRLDIVEVIGSYIKLQKAGANFRAVCPFHSEKKPSFFVSPSRQTWHCFGGCGEGGDIFKFIMKIEGVEFGDALRMLAQKAGVELQKQDPKIKTERTRLYEICELACKFFERQLEESAAGKEAEKYLLERKITRESIKKWRVGYAPDAWQGLSDFLISRGYKKEEIQKAGLGLTSQKGSFFDRFRARIMFPVFDLNSQPVGFGGRVFNSDDPAKYVNTPNTPLYDKSRILYGLDKAKLEIRKKDACILVEGYVDAIMCSQVGHENVAAVSGTALTADQLRILKRYSDNLLTAFDMDLAGDSATKRGIELAQSLGFNIKVLVMKGAKDPADIIAQDPKEWEKIMADAKSILQFYFETTSAKFDSKTPEGKREISKVLLPVIKVIPNKIERAHWIQLLAGKLGVREETVEEALKDVKSVQTSRVFEEEAAVRPAEKKTRKQALAERIVSLILKEPKNLEFLKEYHEAGLTPELKSVVASLRSGEKPDDAQLVSYLSFKAETEEGLDCKEEIQLCLRELEALDVRSRMDELLCRLREAEADGSQEKIDELIKEIHQLTSKLNT